PARRFSRVALIAMLVLVASGVLNALAQVESVAALMGTTHGRLLLAKLVVLVPILALAVVNRTRILPAVAAPRMMRRLAAFVAVEAGLALFLLVLAAAMTLTTPARHAPPTWPLPFRLSPDVVLDVPAIRWRVLIGTQLVVGGFIALLVSMLIRRRAKVLAGAVALVVFGVGIGLPPIVVSAKPFGGEVEPDRAWLVAPDFTVAVGPLAPTALRDYRGRRMVLLVLYTLPSSRARMSELARMYDVLWVTGVEVVAVPAHATRD